jgi:hypothetical protein
MTEDTIENLNCEILIQTSKLIKQKKSVHQQENLYKNTFFA